MVLASARFLAAMASSARSGTVCVIGCTDTTKS
jgi:hypothetical protein